jgi:hypothetical protein
MADDLELIKHFQSLLDNQSRMISENFRNISENFRTVDTRFNKIDEKLDDVSDKLENHEIRLIKIEDRLESDKKPVFGLDNILKYGQVILFLGLFIFYLGQSVNKTDALTVEKTVVKTSSLLSGNLPLPTITPTARSSTQVTNR